MSVAMLEPATVAAPPTALPNPAQVVWGATPVFQRLLILKRARHTLAERAEQLVDAISPTLHRTRADSYAAEILPLLSACRFLEEEAARILKPRRLGKKGLPFWLSGIDATVTRVPLGTILLIAPYNYPLFLPGVQALQALAAGNAVVWKPGRNGRNVADAFAAALTAAGLPAGLLRVTDDSVDDGLHEIAAHPDKIVFTGSAHAGRTILALAAQLLIPVTAELSGCDAVIALPSADPNTLIDALVFGMTLNGSATCMAPRRLFLVGHPVAHQAILTRLQQRFQALDGIELPAATRDHLTSLIAEAESHGATLHGNAGAILLKPLLILNASPDLAIAQADVFAPILTVFTAANTDEVIEANLLCPFGLTAAIFGAEPEARALADRLNVGSVLLNDLIVPTADPRVPFGGRRASGFGVTRGAEGLLEMTAPRVISARPVSRNPGKSTRHFQPTGPAHEQLFRAAVRMTHSGTLSQRFRGFRDLIAAAKNLK
jgi:acyl-CoA reductase-like NAD-dependent aldehyde dehydrogenase